MVTTKAARLRDGLQESIDPRVARTRRAIAQAVRDVLSTTSPGVVLTVADVVRASGVSRSSFYSHFSSLDEVAAFVLGDVFASNREAFTRDRQEALLDPAVALRLAQVRIVDHYQQNRSLFTGLAFQLPSTTVQAGVTRALANEIATTFEALGGTPPGMPVSVVSLYVANGVTGLMNAWLRDEITASPQELVAHLMALLPPWFASPAG